MATIRDPFRNQNQPQNPQPQNPQPQNPPVVVQPNPNPQPAAVQPARDPSNQNPAPVGQPNPNPQQGGTPQTREQSTPNQPAPVPNQKQDDQHKKVDNNAGEIKANPLHQLHAKPSHIQAEQLALKCIEEMKLDQNKLAQLIVAFAISSVSMINLTERLFTISKELFLQSKPDIEALIEELLVQNQIDTGSMINSQKLKVTLEIKSAIALLTELEKQKRELEESSNKHDYYQFHQSLCKFVNGISNLYSKLEKIEKEMAINKSMDPNTGDDISRLQRLNDKEYYTIIVVALEKAGKSSWINSILKQDILPSEKKRCTMVTTVIRSAPEDRVEIEFYNQKEFEEALDLQIKHEFVKEEQRQILTEEFKKQNKQTVIMKGPLEQIKDTLWDYVANQTRVHFIKEARLYTNKLVSRVPIEIRDVPGFDSVIDKHRDMAWRAMEIADSFVFLTDGTRPNLTKPAKELFVALKNRAGAHIMNKGFGVVTHLDRAESPQKAFACFEDTAADLKEVGFAEANILPVVPVLLIKFSGAKDMTGQEIQEISRFVDMTPFLQHSEEHNQKILDYINYDLPLTRLKEALDIARALNQELQNYSAHVKNRYNIHDNLERAVKFEAVQTYWNKAIEAGNIFKTEHLTKKRPQLFDGTVKEFEKTVKKMSEETIASLEKEMYKLDNQLGIPKVMRLHLEERERLQEKHLKNIANVITDVAGTIYKLIVNYIHTMRTTISPHLHLDINRFVIYDQCRDQVEALIMRVAYPVVVAIITFPRNDEQRIAALMQLFEAVPEIFFIQTQQNPNEQQPADFITIKIPREELGIRETAKKMQLL